MISLLPLTQEGGIVCPDGRHIGMVPSQCFLRDRYGPLVERLGYLIQTLGIAELRQVVEAHSRIMMGWPQDLLSWRGHAKRVKALSLRRGWLYGSWRLLLPCLPAFRLPALPTAALFPSRLLLRGCCAQAEFQFELLFERL